MKENKQITIEQLLPLLKPGYVYWSEAGWQWAHREPLWEDYCKTWCTPSEANLTRTFNIAPL